MLPKYLGAISINTAEKWIERSSIPPPLMNEPKVIWLASYPRSGNTLLRTILWHCFGLCSASVYPNDLGGKKVLENYVGHIELRPDRGFNFPPDALPLVKTHELPTDDNPAIYVVRDGRAASVSLWEFYGKSISLETILVGKHRFGTWSAHLAAWKPWERPGTLLIKYEDIADDLTSVLEKISSFTSRAIVKKQIPDRETLAMSDGRWVRGKSDWASKISDDQLTLCHRINGEMLRKLGYLR
jgi:hypothetical protein